MRRALTLTLCSFFLIAATGCGADEAANRDVEPDVAAERDASDTPDDPTSAITGALNEAFGGEGGGVETVDFRTLRDLLPAEVDGMERVDASGEKMGVSGFSFSQAQGEYRSDDGDQQISLQLVDAGAAGPLAMLASWRLVEFDRETSDGYERTTDYEGYPAMEKVRTGDRPRAELQFIVADRFFVSANGQNVEMDELKNAVEKLDLGELEDLRDEGNEQ